MKKSWIQARQVSKTVMHVVFGVWPTPATLCVSGAGPGQVHVVHDAMLQSRSLLT